MTDFTFPPEEAAAGGGSVDLQPVLDAVNLRPTGQGVSAIFNQTIADAGLARSFEITSLYNDLSAAIAAGSGGATPGEVRMFKGATPVGWTRLSGMHVPNELLTTYRFMVGAYDPAHAASSNVRVATASGSIFSMVHNPLGSSTTTKSVDGGFTWAAGTATPTITGLNYVSVAACLGGFGFFGGATNSGTDSNQAARNQAYTYSETSNAWTARANMPTARAYACALPLANGNVVMVGGGTSARTDMGTPILAIHEFNPTTNTWSTRAETLPTGMYAARPVILGNNQFLLIPGYIHNGSAWTTAGTDAAWTVYDANAGTFTAISDVAPFLGAPTFAYPLRDGRILFGNSGTLAYSVSPAAAPGARFSGSFALVWPTGSAGGSLQMSNPAANASAVNAAGLALGVMSSGTTQYPMFLVLDTVDPTADFFYAKKN